VNNPFIIAEIGINHNGDMKIAKKLINMARKTGCDAVKFQKRTLEKCIPKNEWDKLRETPWGNIPYLEYKKHLEFGKEEYDEIDAYCEGVIEWFASAWDLESQAFLRQYDLKYNKVASPMLTNLPMLEMISMEKKMTFMSTGMSTFKQVKNAVDIFIENDCPFILLHCVSTYPCKDVDCNLAYMEVLNETYYPVGYSGHEVGILPSIMAVTMGATVIERHITLDRAMYGSDQSASLERKGLELLVRDVRRISAIMGNGIKRVTQDELKNADKLRYFKGES
jgi:N-acetylneuraminate synthase